MCLRFCNAVILCSFPHLRSCIPVFLHSHVHAFSQYVFPNFPRLKFSIVSTSSFSRFPLPALPPSHDPSLSGYCSIIYSNCRASTFLHYSTSAPMKNFYTGRSIGSYWLFFTWNLIFETNSKTLSTIIYPFWSPISIDIVIFSFIFEPHFTLSESPVFQKHSPQLSWTLSQSTQHGSVPQVHLLLARHALRIEAHAAIMWCHRYDLKLIYLSSYKSIFYCSFLKTICSALPFVMD